MEQPGEVASPARGHLGSEIPRDGTALTGATRNDDAVGGVDSGRGSLR